MATPDPFLDAPPEHAAVLVVRFLLELALLTCVGVLVWQAASGGWRWIAVPVAVAAVATLWWALLSPKAPGPSRPPLPCCWRRSCSPEPALAWR